MDITTTLIVLTAAGNLAALSIAAFGFYRSMAHDLQAERDRVADEKDRAQAAQREVERLRRALTDCDDAFADLAARMAELGDPSAVEFLRRARLRQEQAGVTVNVNQPGRDVNAVENRGSAGQVLSGGGGSQTQTGPLGQTPPGGKSDPAP